MTAFGVMVFSPSQGLLVHGGVRKPDSTVPGDAMKVHAALDVASVQVSGSGPRLSHHAGCLLPDSGLLVLVGGWDGRHRTSAVHVFDPEGRKWLPMAERKGFFLIVEF